MNQSLAAAHEPQHDLLDLFFQGRNGDLGGQNACFPARARASGAQWPADRAASAAKLVTATVPKFRRLRVDGRRDNPVAKKTTSILI